jgi:hypothetical protein
MHGKFFPTLVVYSIPFDVGFATSLSSYKDHSRCRHFIPLHFEIMEAVMSKASCQALGMSPKRKRVYFVN